MAGHCVMLGSLFKHHISKIKTNAPFLFHCTYSPSLQVHQSLNQGFFFFKMHLFIIYSRLPTYTWMISDSLSQLPLITINDAVVTIKLHQLTASLAFI